MPDEPLELLQALERRRIALIERLSSRTETWLAERPRPNAWSLREVAEHLVLAEQATLASIRRNEHRPALRSRWRHAPMRWLIGRALGSSLRIPVTGRVLTPSGQDPLTSIAARWTAVHAAWRDHVDRSSSDQLARPVFRHPLGVPMTLSQTLAFLRQHHDHHLEQITRIERVLEMVRRSGRGRSRI